MTVIECTLFIVFFLVNKKISFITFIFSKNYGLVRYIILYVFGILLTQNDFYFKSLSLFTGIDCVYGLVLDSNQIVNIFEIFFVSDFLRFFFVSDFSFYLLTF